MKDRRQIGWGVALVLAIALFAGDGFAQGKGRQATEGWVEVGFLAPDFTLPDLNGRRMTLSHFRGRKAEIVELTFIVGFQTFASKFAKAFRLTPQGYSSLNR